jgi:hypothetical protein
VLIRHLCLIARVSYILVTHVDLVEIVVILVKVIVEDIVTWGVVSRLIGRTFHSMGINSTRAQPQWFWVKWANNRFVTIVINQAILNQTALNIRMMFKTVGFKVVGMVVDVVLIVVMEDRVDEMVVETEVEVF